MGDSSAWTGGSLTVSGWIAGLGRLIPPPENPPPPISCGPSPPPMRAPPPPPRPPPPRAKTTPKEISPIANAANPIRIIDFII
ncbi:MAG: hypothetical protein V9E86_09745 [Nitrosomonas sp.]